MAESLTWNRHVPGSNPTHMQYSLSRNSREREIIAMSGDHVATVKLSAPNRHHLRYTQLGVVQINYQIQIVYF